MDDMNDNDRELVGMCVAIQEVVQGHDAELAIKALLLIVDDVGAQCEVDVPKYLEAAADSFRANYLKALN